jgi:hypothetical protein
VTIIIQFICVLPVGFIESFFNTVYLVNNRNVIVKKWIAFASRFADKLYKTGVWTI